MAGFFFRVPGVPNHFLYTNTIRDCYLDMNLAGPPSMQFLSRWATVPLEDKQTFQAIVEDSVGGQAILGEPMEKDEE